MVKKFNDFDVKEYLKNKHLNEDVNTEDDSNNLVDIDKPQTVYENPYLNKISNIVLRKLKNSNLGNFGINPDVIYIDGMPGFWIYGIDRQINIVCFRDSYEKKIVVFDTLDLDAENNARITYSTKILGFKNIIDQLIKDLREDEINESIVGKVSSYGWGQEEVDEYRKYDLDDIKYLLEFSTTYPGNPSKQGSALASVANTGDADAENIFKKFGKGKINGNVGKFIMAITRAIIDFIQKGTAGNEGVDMVLNGGEMDDIIELFKSAGVKPSKIIMTAGGVVSVSTTDDPVVAEEKKKKDEVKRQKQMEEYNKNMDMFRKTLTSFCRSTKYNKSVKVDTSLSALRGVILNGQGGFGKTWTFREVMKANGMRENKDYYVFTSGSTTADVMYKKFYKYNNKIICFDDSPKIFSDEYRVSLWKSALQDDIENSKVVSSRPATENSQLYSVNALNGNRYQRYFTEIGKISRVEKNKFYENEIKDKLPAKHISFIWDKSNCDWKDGVNFTEEEKEIVKKIDKDWETKELNMTPKIPDEFCFGGYIVILTNKTVDQIKEDLPGGEEDYKPIKRRMNILSADAPNQALWDSLRKQILDELENASIPSEKCLIQKDMAKEFVDEVDNLFMENPHATLTRATITEFHRRFDGAEGREETWKLFLRKRLM